MYVCVFGELRVGMCKRVFYGVWEIVFKFLV